ncbi:MAG: deoxynucleoside kinase [Oscillospiraceae bacterium]|nr:deoxynucleoside kinase [Oscillospiraceae bacterium]
MVLDGLDGSGKSTQFELLRENLEQRGHAVFPISFPDYAEPSSALVKMYLSGEFGTDANSVNAYAASSFYAVDRFASYKKFWQKEYEAGGTILAARYATSNAIHQMSKLPEAEWDGYLAWLEDYEYRLLELPKPDLVVFLDMPPGVSQKLLSTRYGGDESRRDIHEMNEAYLCACRKAALYAAGKCGWEVLPCSKGESPRPIGEIQNDILNLTNRM